MSGSTSAIGAIDVVHSPAPPVRERASAAPVSRARQQGKGIWWAGLLAAAAWVVLGLITIVWPNKAVGFSEWAYTSEFGYAALCAAAVFGVLGVLGGKADPVVRTLRPAGPWLVASAIGLALWQILTAKLAYLPTPFFAPPQSLVEVVIEDWKRLGDSVKNSLFLLSTGISIGASIGFLVGVWIGWSRAAGYWVHPVLRFLGPIPSTALLPISFYFFPSSFSTAVFLIALGTGFPVAILTWSGVAGVNKSYYDVARTPGASSWFLILRVAIPAALPQVFVGLFMGLGHAFATLVVAEMLGVKSGLGWYLTWAQGWASYPNMYAALLIMALLFSSLITLLFLVRDRVLSWQKGIVKW